MSSSFIAADALLLIIFAAFVAYGAKVGFSRVLLSFATSLGAIIAALFLAPAFGRWIYENIAENILHAFVLKKVTEAGAAISVASFLPDGLVSLLESFGADPAMLGKTFSVSGETAQAVTDTIVNNAAGPALLSVLKGFSAPLLTLVFVIVFNLAAIPLNKTVKALPGIKKFNSLLGGLLGAVKGAIAVTVISLALKIAAPLTMNPFIADAAQTSKIINLVCTLTGIGG